MSEPPRSPLFPPLPPQDIPGLLSVDGLGVGLGQAPQLADLTLELTVRPACRAPRHSL